MIEVELQIPSALKLDMVSQVIEQVCSDNDLLCSLKGTLKSYPGCIHWHFRKSKQNGTLEITWWRQERRLWFKVADHRTATWITKLVPKLKSEIEQALHKT